jgi:hypothetical protein
MNIIDCNFIIFELNFKNYLYLYFQYYFQIVMNSFNFLKLNLVTK